MKRWLLRDFAIGAVSFFAIPLAYALLLSLAFCGGCCNIVVRTEKPYCIAPSPYWCTASVVEDALGAPFRDSSTDPICDAFLTLTWPIWLVDTPCEVVFDTVFLPVDAIAASRK